MQLQNRVCYVKSDRHEGVTARKQRWPERCSKFTRIGRVSVVSRTRTLAVMIKVWWPSGPSCNAHYTKRVVCKRAKKTGGGGYGKLVS